MNRQQTSAVDTTTSAPPGLRDEPATVQVEPDPPPSQNGDAAPVLTTVDAWHQRWS